MSILNGLTNVLKRSSCLLLLISGLAGILEGQEIRTVGILVFDRIQIIDITGTSSLSAMAHFFWLMPIY